MGVTVGTHPSRRTLAPSQREGRGEQGKFNTGHPHEPPPASLKPPQLQVQLPCQCFSRLHIWPQPCSLASALFLHPEPIQGTDPAHVVPWQHDGQVAPAHNQGLNRWGHMHPPCLLGKGEGRDGGSPMSTQGINADSAAAMQSKSSSGSREGRIGKAEHR